LTTVTRNWDGRSDRVIRDANGNVLSDEKSFYKTPSWSWNEIKSGTELPKWRSLVKAHSPATTAYTRSGMTVRVVPGQISTYWKSGLTYRWDHVSGDIIYPSSVGYVQPIRIVDLRNQVHIAWLNKASKKLRTMQSGVSVGELRETLHMVRHPLESLKKGFHDYLVATPLNAKAKTTKRGRAINSRDKRKAIAQAISGTYLEYANGWGPLVRDVISASQTVAEHFTPSGIAYERVTARASAQEMKSSKQVSAYQTTGSDMASWRRTQVVVSTSGVRYVGEVVVSHGGSADDLLRSAGLQMREFVPTMWELLPLSYVADYFINMGSLLEAFCFMSGKRTWWSGSQRDVADSVITGETGPDVGTVAISRSGSLGSCTVHATNFTRFDPGTITPHLEFSLPGKYLFSKLANVTSLFVQARTSSRQLSRLLHG